MEAGQVNAADYNEWFFFVLAKYPDTSKMDEIFTYPPEWEADRRANDGVPREGK